MKMPCVIRAAAARQSDDVAARVEKIRAEIADKLTAAGMLLDGIGVEHELPLAIDPVDAAVKAARERAQQEEDEANE